MGENLTGYEVRYRPVDDNHGVISKLTGDSLDACELAEKLSRQNPDRQVEVWRKFEGSLTRLLAVVLNEEYV